MKKIYSSKFKIFCTLFLTLAVFGVQDVNAQFWKKKKKEVTISKKTPSKKKIKTIDDLTKSSKKIGGLFTIYQDTVTGAVKMLVKKEQLDKDFIYFSQIANGIAAVRAFRGNYQDSKIIHVKKHFNKIEFVVLNTSFYFDKNNAVSKSSDANISDAIVASTKILATDDKTEEYLIEANGLFLSESFTRVKAPKRPGSSPLAFSLGKFDKDKSKINEIKNYPENTNVKTEYVYNNPSVLNGGGKDVTDGRNISIQVFHTFMNMPAEDYNVRLDDPRVGYFLTQVDDMTTTNFMKYRDLISRWKLLKKNPELSVSEPVTPITWWLENSTPIELRETIKEGVLAWNVAFEKAGFKNAVVVKVQPDDATWDAGDIRYNVLRWTSSPQTPFGGYGPHFVNPRTGEILGADIMLEYGMFSSGKVLNGFFSNATSSEFDLETEDQYQKEFFLNKSNQMLCSKGHSIQENTMLGKIVMAASDTSDLELEEMVKEGIKSLIMHEVGHTLGLNHNMKSSHLFSPEQLADAAFIKGKAVTGSVMDYEAINITNDRSKQGQYYSMAIGPYDVWAIQFGYQDFKNKADMDALLDKSTQPELIFGNDADDMRSPGKGIDPRVMTGDLSNDPIQYSINRFELVSDMMKDVKARFSKKGKSYEELKLAYFVLNDQSARAGEVISRFIGGVYVDRAMSGQVGETQPYTPVRLVDQKRAMNALKKYVFAPDAFTAPKELYNFLAWQRRGFDFKEGPEDPKIHQEVLLHQNKVLAHLMHPNTLQRISDSELYGNEYKLSIFMSDLNDMMFKPDVYGSSNYFRQNLQAVYTTKLIGMVTGKASNRFSVASKSMAIYNLKNIKSWVSNGTGDLATKAHKNHLKLLITNAMKEIK